MLWISAHTVIILFIHGSIITDSDSNKITNVKITFLTSTWGNWNLSICCSCRIGSSSSWGTEYCLWYKTRHERNKPSSLGSPFCTGTCTINTANKDPIQSRYTHRETFCWQKGLKDTQVQATAMATLLVPCNLETRLITPFSPQNSHRLKFCCTATGCAASTCLYKCGFAHRNHGLYVTLISYDIGLINDKEFILLYLSYICQNLVLPFSCF